jgi:uncharacterized membrane protein YqaE (UPF0057 family)
MTTPFCKQGQANKICYPSNLFDYFLVLIMPPLYVAVHEFRKAFPKEGITPSRGPNMLNIFKNLILTSLFYFPGFMHAMGLLSGDSDLEPIENYQQ